MLCTLSKLKRKRNKQAEQIQALVMNDTYYMLMMSHFYNTPFSC